MPTILASAILTKVKILIQDTTNIRWADSELLGWLNDGQRDICTKRPDACSKTASVALVAGTKQSLPSDGTAVIKVIRNMGTDGATAGTALRKVPMELLDSSLPDWHAATAVAVVKHFMTDPRNPRVFYVYPPATGTTQVELLYGAVPVDAAATSSAITIDDAYEPALIDYIAFRAFSKDNDLIGNDVRAAMHRKLFEEFLAARTQADAANLAANNIKG